VRLKAEAFANKDWQEYWNTHGPALLATGWVTAHPHVSLQTLLDSVHSLDFLTSAMDQLGLSSSSSPASSGTPSLPKTSGRSRSEPLQLHLCNGVHDDNDTEGCDLQMGGQGAEEAVAVSDEVVPPVSVLVSDDDEGHVVSEALMQKEFDRLKQGVCENILEAGTKENGHVCTEVGIADESDGIFANGIPPTEQLLRLWEAHYNSYYWYAFLAFKEHGEDCQVLYQAESGDVKEEAGPSEIGGNGEEVEEMEAGLERREVGGAKEEGRMLADLVDQEEVARGSNFTPGSGEDLFSSSIDKLEAGDKEETESKGSLLGESNGVEIVGEVPETEDFGGGEAGPKSVGVVAEDSGQVVEMVVVGDDRRHEAESRSGDMANFMQLLRQEEEDEVR